MSGYPPRHFTDSGLKINEAEVSGAVKVYVDGQLVKEINITEEETTITFTDEIKGGNTVKIEVYDAEDNPIAEKELSLEGEGSLSIKITKPVVSIEKEREPYLSNLR